MFFNSWKFNTACKRFTLFHRKKKLSINVALVVPIYILNILKYILYQIEILYFTPFVYAKYIKYI